MSEDVIEFGPTGEPERPPRFRHMPQIGFGAAPLSAMIGMFAVILSFFGPWQTTTLPDEDGFREIGAAVAGVGPMAAAYAVIAALTVCAVALVLFGQSSTRGNARLLGFTLALMGLGVLASAAASLASTSVLVDFRLYPAQDLMNVKFTLEWGIYLAFAGMLALTAALVLSIRPSPPMGSHPAMAAEYEEPMEMELEVSVFPASPKTSPGPGHELYQRP